MPGQPLKRFRNGQAVNEKTLAQAAERNVEWMTERYKLDDARISRELKDVIIKYGVVEHRISPYDALQRAIDDATIDYLMLRRKLERESEPSELHHHEDYQEMLQARDRMVRYSTFAIQYDIAQKQQKITETRIALLGHALQATLNQLGVKQEDIKKAPAMLIENLYMVDKKIDRQRATALTEILHSDAEVTIEG